MIGNLDVDAAISVVLINTGPSQYLGVTFCNQNVGKLYCLQVLNSISRISPQKRSKAKQGFFGVSTVVFEKSFNLCQILTERGNNESCAIKLH